MNVVETTTMSINDKVIIPAIMQRENIFLNPVNKPLIPEFAKIIKLADQIRDDSGLTENDVKAATKASRKSRASRY